MAVAVFDYTVWLARYPEFDGAVGEARAALLFAEAGALYLDNSDASPVQDVSHRLMLLNMLVAHLAAIGGALEAGGKPSGLVGRVSSATEGSVSVSTDMGGLPGSYAWYAQTPYGLTYWQATKSLRSARYVASSPYMFEPTRSWPWRP